MRLSERLSVFVFPLLGCFWMLFDYQQCLCMWSVTVQDSEGSYVILLRLQWQQEARQNSSSEGKRPVGPEAALLLQTIHRTPSQRLLHMCYQTPERLCRAWQGRGLMNAQRYAIRIQNDWANLTQTDELFSSYFTLKSKEKRFCLMVLKVSFIFKIFLFTYLFYLLHFDMMTIKHIFVSNAKCKKKKT